MRTKQDITTSAMLKVGTQLGDSFTIADAVMVAVSLTYDELTQDDAGTVNKEIKMKTGIELIAEERQEQIKKHGRTVDHDVNHNTDFQLSKAASILACESWGCSDEDDMVEFHCPSGWSREIFDKMINKDYRARLIIAGALIAAEIDRLNN